MPDYTTAVGSIPITGGTLTGDLTVESQKTVDGVDVSEHLHTGVDGTGKVDIGNLDNVLIETPATDQVLKYTGTEWVNAPALVVSAGRGTIYYYDDVVSDVTGCETLSRVPDIAGGDVDQTQTVNDSTELIYAYVSSLGGLGISQINAGTWIFHSYTYLSTGDGVTKLRYIVHKIDNADPWAETELFSVDSAEITTVGTGVSDAVLYTTETTQTAFTITETQRLKIEVWATTDNVGDVVVHLVHSGDYTSSIETPLPTKHNDLAGLEGGNSEFYHLTLEDFTGTGTGIFARKNDTTLTGDTVVDRIGIGDTPTTTYKLNLKDGHIKLQQVTRPITGPTVATGAAGLLTGDYYYRISYITAIGETDTGTVSDLIQPSSQKVELTDIPVSTNANVTDRAVYRTTNGGSIYRMQLVGLVGDNTTTTYTDNIIDGSLTTLDKQVNTTGGFIYVDGVRSGFINPTSTGYGYDALSTNNGHYSTAIGVDTLKNNTYGDNNTAVGHQALKNNTTGLLNTSVGYNSLLLNVDGEYNTAVGSGALDSNVSGNYNTALGAYTLAGNTTGYSNVALGLGALEANSTGNENVAVGVDTLVANNGDGNVVIGNEAGYTTTTGSYNTFIGFDSGHHASQKVDATNSVAIGNGAYTTADNQVVVGNSSITSVTINGSIQSPTIVTPTVASLVNMNHTHAASGATGGTVSHTVLSDKGTTTHADIDTAINTTLPGLVTTHAASINTHGSGVVMSSQISTIQVARNLNNDNVIQNIFPTTHDVFTAVEATTYKIRGILYISGATTTNHTTSLAFTLGDGASLTEISYTTRATQPIPVNTVYSGAADRAWVTQAASTVVTGNGKGPTAIQLDGIIRVNLGGTITPQLTFNTAPGGTPAMALGSFIEFIPIGTNTMTATSSWS